MIHKLDRFPHCVDDAAAAAAIGEQRVDVCTEPSRSAKRTVFGGFTNFCQPEFLSGQQKLGKLSNTDLFAERLGSVQTSTVCSPIAAAAWTLLIG